MTWQPAPQDPCTGDCTCNSLSTGEPWTPLERAMPWPDVPAEPVRPMRQWIEDTDPAPVEPPPEPARVPVDHDTDARPYAMTVTPWWRRILKGDNT